MHDAQVRHIQPHRLRLKPPYQIRVVGCALAGIEKGLVLASIFIRMRSKILYRVVRILREIRDRVEFMITHYEQRSASINHRSDDIDNPALIRPTVDKATKKDYLSLWMPIHAISHAVIKLASQLDQ